MPRIAGVNVVGVIVATLVFYFVGFVFYGLLFDRIWLLEQLIHMEYPGKAINVDQLSTALLQEEMQKAHPGASPALSMILGFLNALVTVVILAVVIRYLTAEAPGLIASLGWTALVIVGFVITTLAYDHIYAMHSMTLFWIDAGHLLCAYLASAVILTLMD